jgi:hypothetical protein
MDKNAINKNMDEKLQETPQSDKKPDEKGGIYVEGRIKIFDPETNEVYVNGRA